MIDTQLAVIVVRDADERDGYLPLILLTDGDPKVVAAQVREAVLEVKSQHVGDYCFEHLVDVLIERDVPVSFPPVDEAQVIW